MSELNYPARHRNKANKQGVINRDVNAASRAATAVSLRAQRLTFEEIARRCGYASPGACRNAVQRELQRTMSGKTDDLRREELDMLNRLHAAIWPLAVPENSDYDEDKDEEGDKKGRKKKVPSLYAADRILAISERRSKLMGLDTPIDSAVFANQIVVREVPQNYFGITEAKSE